MSIIDSIKSLFQPDIQTLSLPEPQSAKAAFQLQQVGVTGRAEFSDVNRDALHSWARRNELVYACIEKIKQAAIDPTPVVERADADGNWERIPGHPLARLLARPNPQEDGASFWGAWLASEHIFGEAFAEIERNGVGQPKNLWLLNPLNMKPVAGKGQNGSPIVAYEYTLNGRMVRIPAEDVLVRRNKDLTNPFFGESPLRVAMGAVDMDTAQTDFVRAFFNNGGVPSGLLRFPNSTLTPERAEEARQRFMAKYGRGGRGAGGVAVLDQNAEYQKVGANLNELEAETLRGLSESRICSVFGVPPILVGAYVALVNVNQRASVREAQTDFWINKMSPLFKALRTFLTHALLPEFAARPLIEAERIRVSWDMSKVMALQEDTDARHARARKDFQAGGITLNEFRAEIGKAPDETNGDYYLRPRATVPQTPEIAFLEAEKPPAKQLADGNTVDGEIIEEDEKRAALVLTALRKSLIKQAVEQIERKSAVALVPHARSYAELQKHLTETEANELVAGTVAEVQERAQGLAALGLSIEEIRERLEA